MDESRDFSSLSVVPSNELGTVRFCVCVLPFKITKTLTTGLWWMIKDPTHFVGRKKKYQTWLAPKVIWTTTPVVFKSRTTVAAAPCRNVFFCFVLFFTGTKKKNRKKKKLVRTEIEKGRPSFLLSFPPLWSFRLFPFSSSSRAFVVSALFFTLPAASHAAPRVRVYF